jgi:uncharacterized Ntn-hydrolase superfamily protein
MRGMGRRLLLAVVGTLAVIAALVFSDWTAHDEASPLVGTFSIVGFDKATGDLGVAVQSKFPNVRAVVPWARAGVGAVATQSFVELDYGIDGLELMARGASAEEALSIVLRRDPRREQRQVGIVDAQGRAATWTGKECFGWAGARVGIAGAVKAVSIERTGLGTVVTGEGFTAQGNTLVSEDTAAAMADAYQRTTGELSERLLAALVAGGKAGGDRRGEQSAALLVVRKGAGYDGQDNFVDISVYDHPTPIAELVRLEKLNRLHFRATRPESLVPVTADVARELKTIWTARGFWRGPIDGTIAPAFQKTLVDFMGWENYDTRIEPVEKIDLAKGETLVIDREVLDDIRTVFAEKRWKPKVP